MNALITPPTQHSLDELENIIERGIATFVEVGLALEAIRENRLYIGASKNAVFGLNSLAGFWTRQYRR